MEWNEIKRNGVQRRDRGPTLYLIPGMVKALVYHFVSDDGWERR